MQNVTSGTNPKFLDLCIKCFEVGLTVILYTTYAVEPKPANRVEVTDSYSANKWCFISSLLASCPPVYAVM